MGHLTRVPTLAAALVAVAAFASCGSGGGDDRALSVRRSADARSSVRGARFIRPITVDGGALRIEPADGSPSLSEGDAIALFRAGSTPETRVAGVVIAYGRATLRVTPSKRAASAPATPRFIDRPAWAVLWTPGPRQGCRATPAGTRQPGRSPIPVLLIAADGSGEGVSYSGRGSVCGGKPIGPTATVADYYRSQPWTVVTRHPGSTVITTRTKAGCLADDGLLVAAGGSPSAFAAGVYTRWYMAGERCRTRGATFTETIGSPGTTELAHAPTGLSVGRTTRSGQFTYFDGRTRRIR